MRSRRVRRWRLARFPSSWSPPGANGRRDDTDVCVRGRRTRELQARRTQTAVPNLAELRFGPQYDVSADGERFLLAQALEEDTSVPITVIVNWPALLKKGSPAQ